MSLLPLGFLLLVVVLGGVTAYYADQLGRHLGKRRYTLWKMRPRHTAALITTGAGMMIPLLTIGILSAASRDFRQWILEAPRAIIDRDQLRSEVKGLRDQEDRLKQTTTDLEKQKTTAETLLAKTTKELRTAGGELVKLQGQIRGLRQRVQQSNALVVRLNRRVTEVQNDLRTASLNLDTERKQLDRTRNEFREAFRQRDEAYTELTRLLNENAAMEREVGTLNTSVRELNTQRDQLRKDIVDAREAFDKVIEGNQEELRRVQFDLERSRIELDEINTKLASFQRMLATSVEVSRTRAMTFRLGEEVARVAVPANATPNDAAGIVSNLLRASQAAATERKAKARGTLYPVAGIFPREDSATGRTITPDLIRDAITRRIANSMVPLVLISYSSLNAFEEEPVSLEVAVLDNPIIYLSGGVIAETRVDGARDEVVLYQQIAEFVESRVKERARGDRMIPRAGAANPFGVVTASEILSLVKSVRTFGRPVRIQAVASRQIRAGDPLEIDFRLR